MYFESLSACMTNLGVENCLQYYLRSFQMTYTEKRNDFIKTVKNF